MSRSIRAIIYEAHGKPEEVLRLGERELSAPGPGEVVVRLKAAPINPADLNAIEGKYPVRFELPATPGFEGAGVIEEVGAKPQSWRPINLSSCRTRSHRRRRRC